LAAAAAAFGLALTASNGFNRYDEPWFLQVLSRMSQGEVLYRDIFFGTTPLSAWIGWLAVKLSGVEILAVKTVESICFGALVWTTVSSYRLLSGNRPAPWVLVLAVCLFARPGADGPGSLYVPLAATASMACLYFFLRSLVHQHGAWVWPALAGAAAGAGFAAKHTVGFAALAALVAAIMLTSKGEGGSRRKSLIALGASLAAFAVAVFLALLPVFLQGGAARMWHYCVGNKANYLRFGSLSYINIVLEQIRGLSGPTPGKSLRSLNALTLALLPPAAGALAVCRWIGRPSERRKTAAVMAFLAALATGACPRPDSYHLSSISPAMLLGLGFGWEVLGGKTGAMGTWARRAAMAAMLSGLAFLAARPVVRAASGRYEIARAPHFRGVMADKELLDRSAAIAESLAGLAGNGGTFVASPQAGLYCLMGGMYNPTPYDYPVASALGESGQREVIGLIEEGWIPAVALDGEAGGEGMGTLAGYVRGEMSPAGMVGGLEIFRARPTAKAKKLH